jgi:hypothetical protein
MYFLRIILILFIIYLIAKVFINAGSGERTTGKMSDPGSDKNNTKTSRGVPKNIGEYVDYEEVKKSNK